MLVGSLFCTVADGRSGWDNSGKDSLIPLTLSYSSNNVTDAITGHSSEMYSMNESQTGRTITADVVEDLPAKMKLLFSEAPVLNSESKLNLIFDPEVDAPNTEMRIVLPEGLSLVSGDLRWTGSLSKNQVVQINITVKAEMVGNWRVEAVATSKPIAGYPKVCSTQCYVQITETVTHVFDAIPEDSAKVDAARLNDNKNPGHAVESLKGNITVYGYWYYQDKKGISRPVRYALVQLWADAVPSDVCLAATYVQSDGYYKFPPVPKNNGSLSNGYDIYVKVLCDSYPYQIVTVGLSQNDPSKPPITYWSATETHYNVTDGDQDMGTTTVTGDKRECWAIYDNVVDGYFWLLNEVGWCRSKVFATAQDLGSGSRCTGNGMVFYLGDGWNRDTVLHEYGHCIQYAARRGSFPPKAGPDEHYPDSETDGGWAICEGWAEFFPCAVDNTPLMCGGGYGSIESTTYANGPFGHGDYGDWDGDVVEGAVAQVFWDIFDGTSSIDYPWGDEYFGDYISNEFGKLSDIFLYHSPNDIHDFLAQWTPKDSRIWAIFHHARILVPRDLAVTNVTTSQPKVVLGETGHINFTVRNQGDTLETFNITASVDGLTISSFENITLESGSSEIFTVGWNTTGVLKGEHAISARVVVFPKDLNPTDDVGTHVVTVMSPGHDVGINSISLSKVVIGQGYSISVRIDVRNYGIFPEVFNVTVSANSTVIGILSKTYLESGNSTVLALDWDTTGYSMGNYTISVYITPLEGEGDISDNMLTTSTVKVTIPGDVNGDFIANFTDAAQVSQYWQKTAPPAPANVDVNGDGIMDISDAAIIGLNWQKHV